MKKMTWGWHC